VLPIVNSGETKQISVNDLSAIMSNSIADLGFIVRPKAIDKDVLLPENSDVLYFDALNMGTGTLTIPNTTTLTIAISTPSSPANDLVGLLVPNNDLIYQQI
jgi:hypothetical protein